ncbi:MAG: type II toxin-antitoxin system RelE/ParE family toxin [Gammaproteobacteria bacterium]
MCTGGSCRFRNWSAFDGWSGRHDTRGGGTARPLYCFLVRRRVVVLHAFTKKAQQRRRAVNRTTGALVTSTPRWRRPRMTARDTCSSV